MKKATYTINNIGNLRFITVKEIEELGFLRHFISCKPAEALINYSMVSYLNDILQENNMNIDNNVYLKQIHSSIFFEVDKNNCNSVNGIEGDALVVSEANIPIGIFTADCVPIIIIDKRQGISAVAHAGWRGTEKEIVKKVINYMVDIKDSLPSDILCVIGPCIGQCCFEVGDEVASKFSFVEERKGKIYVDLVSENMKQIIVMNVPEDNVYCVELCTKCNNDLLPSYRSEGSSCGRIATFIEIIENRGGEIGK